MSDAPHHQAAFINVINEEGTKAEAVKYLQETWNELCEARARIRELEQTISANKCRCGYFTVCPDSPNKCRGPGG